MTFQDFYEFAGTGIILSKSAKRRVFFLAGKSWVTLENELFKTFSTGAAVMLNHMGRTYGQNLAKEVKMRDPRPSRVLDTLKSLAVVSGWGDISINGDRTAGTSLEVSMTNCIFCSDPEKTNSSSCHFLAGIVLGATDEAYGSLHAAVETRCARAGGDSCVISIKSSEQ